MQNRTAGHQWTAVQNRRSVIAIASLVIVGLVASACNPLTTDPVPVGGEFDLTSARYGPGPEGAWFEVAVTGATPFSVYALADVGPDDRTGPLTRACAGEAGPEPCYIATGHVQSTQRMVPQNTTGRLAFVRLITLWPEEVVGLVLVCVEPATQELGCPDSLRARLRMVDDGGNLVGDLTAVPNNS